MSERTSVPNSSLDLIRLALGLNYIHFGYLKFFPDLSPAEVLANYVGQRLAHYWIDPGTALLVVAVLECLIGAAFLFNIGLRWVAPLFFFHMAATFLPLFLLPEVTFKFAPLAPTLEGQYILKNFVLLSAGWVVLAPHMHYRFWRKAGSQVDEPAASTGETAPSHSTL